MIECFGYKRIQKGTLEGFANITIHKWGIDIYGVAVFNDGAKKWFSLPKKEYKDPEETKNNPIKASLELFNDMKRLFLSTEAPHLGCAAVFFRGDYSDCQEFIDFIVRKKGRPYYEERK